MQRGELIGSHRCLGYDYDSKTKTISVNQEEAKIVKYIFKRYLEGYGVRTIGRELAKLGYKTIKGSASWSDGTILDLLKNVKYKGDLIQGRTYTVDPISKRRIPNDGTTDMFYIKDHHEAIISPEDFDKAQELNKMKRDAFGHRKTKEETDIIYHRLYAFTGICYCSYCGSRMFRRKTTAIQNSKFVWHCTNHVRNGKSYCPDSRAIDESALEKAFVESFNQLIENKISNVDDI